MDHPGQIGSKPKMSSNVECVLGDDNNNLSVMHGFDNDLVNNTHLILHETILLVECSTIH